MKLGLYISVAIKATLLMAFLFAKIYACSCIGQSPEQEFERAEAVFYGTVTDIAETALPSKNYVDYDEPFLAVKFVVKEGWKGSNQNEITILTPRNSCMFDFRESESYLVYAFRQIFTRIDSLETHNCKRTRKFSDARDDLDYIVSLSQSIDQADFDRNGNVDFSDFITFAQAFGSTHAPCDINMSGKIDFADFIAFVRVFGKSTFTVKFNLELSTQSK